MFSASGSAVIFAVLSVCLCVTVITYKPSTIYPLWVTYVPTPVQLLIILQQFHLAAMNAQYMPSYLLNSRPNLLPTTRHAYATECFHNYNDTRRPISYTFYRSLYGHIIYITWNL